MIYSGLLCPTPIWRLNVHQQTAANTAFSYIPISQLSGFLAIAVQPLNGRMATLLQGRSALRPSRQLLAQYRLPKHRQYMELRPPLLLYLLSLTPRFQYLQTTPENGQQRPKLHHKPHLRLFKSTKRQHREVFLTTKSIDKNNWSLAKCQNKLNGDRQFITIILNYHH